jgi:hypothetical protein
MNNEELERLIYFYNRIVDVDIDETILDLKRIKENDVLIDLIHSYFNKVIPSIEKPKIVLLPEASFYHFFERNTDANYFIFADKIILKEDDSKSLFLKGVHEYVERYSYLKKYNFDKDIKLRNVLNHTFSLGVHTLIAEKSLKQNKKNNLFNENMEILRYNNYEENSFISKYIQNREKTLEEYNFKF